MTDEELVKRLRDGNIGVDADKRAADRIEALINLNEALVELMDDRDAKLAKAVEALRFYADENRYGLPSDGPWGLGSTDFGKIARALLAEIEGGKG
jgi:hypothetical protein